MSETTGESGEQAPKGFGAQLIRLQAWVRRGFSEGRSPALWLMALVVGVIAGYGALALTIYSLSVAHVNDIAEQGRFVEISSGMLLMFGAGAAAGPILASTLMDTAGFAYLFAYTALLHGAIAAYCTYRLMRLRRELKADRPSIVITMPRAAPMPPKLDPRAGARHETVYVGDALTGIVTRDISGAAGNG